MSLSVLAAPEQSFHLACFRWVMPLATSFAQQNYLEPQEGILKYLNNYTEDRPAEFLLRRGQDLFAEDGLLRPPRWRLDACAGDEFRRRGHIAILKMGPLYLWCQIVESGMGHDWWPNNWREDPF